MPEMCIRINITKNMMNGGGIIVLVLLGTQSSSDTNIYIWYCSSGAYSRNPPEAKLAFDPQVLGYKLAFHKIFSAILIFKPVACVFS